MCDGRVGGAERVCHLLISQTGCQSPQPRDTAGQAAVICVYEGVRSVCIDWQQLDTGNCHQNADLQKVEQAAVEPVWPRQYGFVAPPRPSPAALDTRQMLRLRKG